MTFSTKIFTANSLLSVLAKEFSDQSTFGWVKARKRIASRAQCVWALSCWKMNSPVILSTARNSCY